MSKQQIKRSWLKLTMSFLAVVFGLATLKKGGAVIFFAGEGRLAAGDYVPFVVWFNFFAGFFYILAGIQLLRAKECVPKLASVIAVATTLVFIAFGVWIALGYPFETRTIGAMTLRSVFWIGFALILRSRYRANRVLS